MEKNLQDIKAQCIEEVRAVLERYRERLVEIDPRVWEYAQDVVRTDIDIHNIDEILGLRKFLRLMDTYEFDYEYFKDILYDAEGEWRYQEGRWRHIRGGLKIDGIFGYTYYRQTQMQVFVYAWVFGFSRWYDTTSPIGSRDMLPTEKEGEDGTILDYRRLVRTFILLWPRKMAKTFTSGFICYETLMRGERDAQVYIAANSSEQSKVLWSMCDKSVTQHDGWHRYFRRSDSDQHRFIKFKNNNPTGRVAEVVALSAGAKTKDGLKASVIAADEFGAAQRTRGNAADMEKLVGVLEGSQGPIREPLTFHSSTAGTGLETPYEQMITSTHGMLLEEMDIPLDGCAHVTSNDWQGCVLLRPDEWERGDDNLLRSERVIKKVNPNLGITIQPDYYKMEWEKADKEGDIKRKEVVTKLYNIFCTDRAVDWITGDEVRPLMIMPNDDTDWPKKIEDCKYDEGWITYTGMDFTNVGDDFQALTYVAARRRKNGKKQFFVQFEAWTTLEAVMKSPYKNLFLQWGEQGYLHIVPKKTINSSLAVNRIVELRNVHKVNTLGFGYDPFKAKEAVNDIRTWMASMGVRPENLGNHIMPVGQTYGAVSPVLEEVTALIYSDEDMIRFAYSPLVPFEFSNCRVAESVDGMENKKIIKSRDFAKIDNCQSMLNAFSVHDAQCFKVK